MADDQAKSFVSTRQRNIRILKTQSALNAVSVIEGFDLQLLPSLFKVLQKEFDWNLGNLARLTLFQSTAHALSASFWGFLADSSPRLFLLVSGCLIWGIVNILISFSSQWWHFCSLKILDGVALASLGPIAQSVIPDLYPTKSRGQQFGWLQMFLSAGCIIGALCGGVFSGINISEGYQGWRLAYLICGNCSLVIGILAAYLWVEPERKTSNNFSNMRDCFMGNMKSFAQATTSRTFLVLTLEGISGSIPLHAFSYYTLWFQYIGMSNYRASLLTTCLLIGSMLGSVIGGWIADRAHKLSRFSGRAFVGQMSTIIAIPLIYSALMVVPRRPNMFGSYATIMLTLGFLIAWTPSGVNRPILSDVVNTEVRATVFATLATLEGSVSALLGSPVIAFMAQSIFGYNADDSQQSFQDKNVQALAEALLIATALPWMICFAMYSLLHFTYKEDSMLTMNSENIENAGDDNNQEFDESRSLLSDFHLNNELPDKYSITEKGPQVESKVDSS